ncbi:hypothetical protein LA080_007198 [Diaporthe eres]|nr:hypothetical protein LA080_007198 [Diaporthe eres]
MVHKHRIRPQSGVCNRLFNTNSHAIFPTLFSGTGNLGESCMSSALAGSPTARPSGGDPTGLFQTNNAASKIAPSLIPTPFKTNPERPPSSASSTTTSLVDTEPWDNHPSPPALLDILNSSDISISGRRSESPPRPKEDINSDPVDEHSYQDQPRADIVPPDSSNEVHNHHGAHRTLHGGDEQFLSYAVGQASVVYWLYYIAKLKRFKRYIRKIAQGVGNGLLPGVPTEVEWLMRGELPSARLDVLQNVALCGLVLSRAGGQKTGFEVLGLSDEDKKLFTEWCQEIDENS